MCDKRNLGILLHSIFQSASFFIGMRVREVKFPLSLRSCSLLIESPFPSFLFLQIARFERFEFSKELLTTFDIENTVFGKRT